MHDLCGRNTIPRRKGALSEYSIVFGRYQMPPKIEQIVDGCVNTQEPLRLTARLESPHPSFPHSRGLVRLLSPIVRVLISYMDGFRYQLPMRDPVTPQLVRHNLPGLTSV